MSWGMVEQVPTWLRPGGWARAVADQALDASAFGQEDPHPLSESHVLIFEPRIFENADIWIQRDGSLAITVRPTWSDIHQIMRLAASGIQRIRISWVLVHDRRCAALTVYPGSDTACVD
eukprot:6852047-Pyramimonas_sp.AAC.1